MLDEIRVENLLIIDSLEVGFHAGLNVISGETGVGKSLFLGAVGCLFGAKIDAPEDERREIRIEGRFHVASEDAESLPEGLRPDEGDDLVVRIVRRPGGTQRCYVNGSLVSRPELRELGLRLVDVHGQRDMQRLLSQREQVLVLDRFAGTVAAARRFAELHAEEKRLLERSRKRDERLKELAERLELLAWQGRELESAGLIPGEQAELHARHRILSRAQESARALGQAADFIEEEGGARARLTRLGTQVERLADGDPELAGLAQRLFESAAQLEDLARDLQDLATRRSELADDPRELEERLALLDGLVRKYRRDEAGLIALTREIAEETAALERERTELDDMDGLTRRVRSEIDRQGRELAERREEAGARLATAVSSELADLKMPHAEFRVESGLAAGIPGSALGFGNPGFRLRSNPGQPLAALEDCASGGELSRVLLALKSVLAANQRMPLLIFDEVETGVGPRLGALLGRKLLAMSAHRQVLCITHLPQIAACADRHLRIDKAVEGDRTRATLEELKGRRRLEELAAMLGGGDGELALRQARALLEDARGGHPGREAIA